jgi:hypothetical protein
LTLLLVLRRVKTEELIKEACAADDVVKVKVLQLTIRLLTDEMVR